MKNGFLDSGSNIHFIGLEENIGRNGETREVAVDSKVQKFKEKLEKMKCKNDVLRESLAEFLGTFILTLMGNSLLAVLLLDNVGKVGAIAGPIGWGVALMVAISVTGGVSGCHANPAVTLAFASVGKLPWRKVMPYFFAQYAGAFVSSIVLYAVYFELLDHYDGGVREVLPSATATAQIFATYPNANVTSFTAFGDQVVSMSLFMMSIAAVTDPHNMAVPKGSIPLIIGLSLAATIFAFPLNCGAPLNPARDLGPRVFTALAGWGSHVFSFRDYNYFWVPVLGPHVGAVIGIWLYKLLVELHWPVDSYDFAGPTEVKSNGEFKKKDDLPFVDKKRIAADGRKTEE